MKHSSHNKHGEPLFVRHTGAGAGGIATLVLDGWGLAPKLQPLLRAKKALRETASGEMQLARLVDTRGQLVDEVVIVYLQYDQTETGHEQIELSCHGGMGSVQAVEAALRGAGFNKGAPHELLGRAYLNGKLPLVAVEARLRLAQAATPRQADFLLGYQALRTTWERHGFEVAMGLRRQDGTWRNTLHTAAVAALAQARAGIKLLATHHVVLAGPVNAGKSTLANLLARADRHLVSDVPGTTRDRLDLPLAVRGLHVLLTDAAGLRDTGDELERAGQRRAREAALQAALRLLVLDGSRPPSDADLQLAAELHAAGPTLVVLNKQDLGLDENAAGLGFVTGSEPVVISAHTGAGLDALEAALETALLGASVPANGDPFTHRQMRHLEEMVSTVGAGSPGIALVGHIREFLGTRADPVAFDAVLRELKQLTTETRRHGETA